MTLLADNGANKEGNETNYFLSGSQTFSLSVQDPGPGPGPAARLWPPADLSGCPGVHFLLGHVLSERPEPESPLDKNLQVCNEL